MSQSGALQPSALWYATRGAGAVALILLTASIFLGIVTSVRWKSDEWPRFLVASLHRNISLMVVAFGLIHAATAVLDPLVSLGLKAAVVPFASSYRPLWLGLGVISAELLVAIAATSLLRQRLGYLAWRIIHWLTYATWPLAMLHSLGTGTDSHSGWFLFVAAGCTGSVLAAAFWRVNRGLEERPALRHLAQGTCLAGALVLVGWTAQGPLRPGWARAAGTPAYLLAGGSSAGAQAAALPAGLNDRLQGSLSRSRKGGLQVRLADLQHPALQVIITVLGSEGSQANMTVSQNGVQVCAAPASVNQLVTAQCGQTAVSISLQRGGEGESAVIGQLNTQALTG
ncbi:MAG: ferric reductase-like transmembrane domain-containing protein [Chloroflexota bacterium]